MKLAAILCLAVAAPLSAQTISRTPVTPNRPVAIHREPRPAPAPERPAPPVVIVEGGYSATWLAAYGYYPVPSVYPTYVQQAPPAAQAEVPGPAPAPAMAFVAGHYQWNGASFNWQAGRWVPIPAGYIRWVNGRWEQNVHGFYWINGYWVP